MLDVVKDLQVELLNCSVIPFYMFIHFQIYLGGLDQNTIRGLLPTTTNKTQTGLGHAFAVK